MAAAVVVVSSHANGSGLRVIARASTSSMRVTGTISSPLLMLSAISTRSLAFSSGMSTVLMPPRKAASSFSLRPAIGHTRPRSVISPVMATSRRTGNAGHHRDDRGDHGDAGGGAILRCCAFRPVDVDVALVEPRRFDALGDRAQA